MRLTYRLAPRERVVLVAGAVLVAMVTADIVAGGLVTYLDESVRDATMPVGDPPGWTEAVGVLGSSGVGGGALTVAAIVTMQVLWRWWPGALAATNLAVTGLTVTALKHLVGRSGPGGGDPTSGYPGYFPSGHTATAAVSFGTIVFLVSCWSRGRLRRARRRGLAAGLTVGSAVAVASVLGGYHWLSDTLASLVVAAVVLQVSFGVWEGYVDRPSAVPRSVG